MKEGCYPYQDSNLAVGSNEWGCCESEEDDFGKHICDGLVWSKRTLEKNEVIKIVSGYESIVSGCRSELRYELDESRQV